MPCRSTMKSTLAEYLSGHKMCAYLLIHCSRGEGVPTYENRIVFFIATLLEVWNIIIYIQCTHRVVYMITLMTSNVSSDQSRAKVFRIESILIYSELRRLK